MLTATLVRGDSTEQGTFGRLQFGAQSVNSVELPWRGNRRQRSCIPPGEYACRLVRSPRFGRVYAVADVPNRSNVLIHAANLAGDVDLGWDSQLHGCIAPCERFGYLRSTAGRMQRAGLVSRPALSRLMAWADERPFTLTIKDDS